MTDLAVGDRVRIVNKSGSSGPPYEGVVGIVQRDRDSLGRLGVIPDLPLYIHRRRGRSRAFAPIWVLEQDLERAGHG